MSDNAPLTSEQITAIEAWLNAHSKALTEYYAHGNTDKYQRLIDKALELHELIHPDNTVSGAMFRIWQKEYEGKK